MLLTAVLTVISTNCPNLGKGEHKIIIYSKQTSAGSIAQHSCDPGYIIDGPDSQQTCNPNGTWTGRNPQCIGMSGARNDRDII